MSDFVRFDQNTRSRGVLVDTNLLVLLIVGSVNRDRIPHFKRTSQYTQSDWDLLTGILEQIEMRLTIPHVLSEVSALTDMKGPERDDARAVLRAAIALMQELPVNSLEACTETCYTNLGLTDAALGMAARQTGCSVLTNDSNLYATLLGEGASVVKFDHLRELL